jgi:acetyltransferase-like isoleucine patch superfamily enzyme
MRVLVNPFGLDHRTSGIALPSNFDQARNREAPADSWSAIVSLTRLAFLRKLLTKSRLAFFRRVMKMDIHPTVEMSLSAKPDMTFPKGVHIGQETYVAFNARILTHDRTRGLYVHTRVGCNCFIGGESLILPGITIGDNCVIGAGSVVTKDVPPRSIVAGNPAKVIRSDIEVGPYGRFIDADDTELRLRATDPSAADLPNRMARQGK